MGGSSERLSTEGHRSPPKHRRAQDDRLEGLRIDARVDMNALISEINHQAPVRPEDLSFDFVCVIDPKVSKSSIRRSEDQRPA